MQDTLWSGNESFFGAYVWFEDFCDVIVSATLVLSRARRNVNSG